MPITLARLRFGQVAAEYSVMRLASHRDDAVSPGLASSGRTTAGTSERVRAGSESQDIEYYRQEIKRKLGYRDTAELPSRRLRMGPAHVMKDNADTPLSLLLLSWFPDSIPGFAVSRLKNGDFPSIRPSQELLRVHHFYEWSSASPVHLYRT
jgi:hypothetical protein